MADVVTNGVRLNVVTMGEGGLTLVFVHGLLLDNHASFYMTLAPGLAKRARVVLYDLRGHGLSEQPRSGYTVTDMTADLAGLVEAVSPASPVVVVGHSYGGYVAMRFAVTHAARVAGLVLIEAHTGIVEFGRQLGETLALTGAARDRKIEELFGNWLARHRARGIDQEGADADAALGTDAQATVKLVQRLRRRRKSSLVATAQRLHGETTFATDIAASETLDEAALARVTCPVLALFGEHSDLRPGGKALAERLPNCRLLVVPGGEHGIMFQATAYVRDAMTTWIDEVLR